jgi:hypothetical protein
MPRKRNEAAIDNEDKTDKSSSKLAPGQPTILLNPIRCIFMKAIKLLLPLLGLTVFAIFATPAKAQLTYNDGDCFLGFRSTNDFDSTQAYLVNVGSSTQFEGGSDVTLSLGNIAADLESIYGPDWYTRDDIFWAIVGCYVPTNILYSTNPDLEAWPRDSFSGQGPGESLIDTMRVWYTVGEPTQNSSVATIQLFTNEPPFDNTYPSFQPGGWQSGNISFQTFNPTDEQIPNQALYFNRVIPATGSDIGKPGDLLGYFSIDSGGTVKFTAGTGVIPTPTPTPTPSGTPTPTISPTATPTPSGTPIGSPTPTTTPIPPGSGLLGNISTRIAVQTGDNVLIGGFIVSGTEAKNVIVRAIGPSLPLSGSLADPVLDLYDSAGHLLVSNDNWGDAPNSQDITNSGIAPTNRLESAILMSLTPGAYTAIVRGANSSTGIALIEAYAVDSNPNSSLANISSRGLVESGDNVMIGGFIIVGANPRSVLVRAIGPSLPLSGTLSDPMLELHDANGILLASNDNWRDTQQAEIAATGIPPSNDAEAAIFEPLSPGPYTAVVRGKNNSAGVALVEIYSLNQ